MKRWTMAFLMAVLVTVTQVAAQQTPPPARDPATW